MGLVFCAGAPRPSGPATDEDDAIHGSVAGRPLAAGR